MSKNKIALSLVVAGILGASSALAETSAGFVGLQGNTGFGGHTKKSSLGKLAPRQPVRKLKIPFISLAFWRATSTSLRLNLACDFTACWTMQMTKLRAGRRTLT